MYSNFIISLFTFLLKSIVLITYTETSLDSVFLFILRGTQR